MMYYYKQKVITYPLSFLSFKANRSLLPRRTVLEEATISTLILSCDLNLRPVTRYILDFLCLLISLVSL